MCKVECLDTSVSKHEEQEDFISQFKLNIWKKLARIFHNQSADLIFFHVISCSVRIMFFREHTPV